MIGAFQQRRQIWNPSVSRVDGGSLKLRQSILELGGKAMHIRNSSLREVGNVCSLVKVRPFSNTFLDQEYNALEYYHFMKESKRGWKKTKERGEEATVKCYPKITTQELKFEDIGSVSSEGSIETTKIPDSRKDDSSFEGWEDKELLLSKTSALLSVNTPRSVRKKRSQHSNRQSGGLALRLSPCSYPSVSEICQETDKITNVFHKQSFSKNAVKKSVKSIRVVLPRPNDAAKDLTECSTFSNTLNGYKVLQNRKKNAKALSTKIPEWKRKLTLPMVTMNNGMKRDKSFIPIQYSKEVNKLSLQRPIAKTVELPDAACLKPRPAKEVGGLRGKNTTISRHFMQNNPRAVTQKDEFLPVVKQCFKHDALTNEDSPRNLRLRYVRR